MSVKNKIGFRPTWAQVNISNLKFNFKQIRKLLPANVKIMATVKADAYGHGLIQVSKALVACKTDFFGVASIDEGIRLRKAGIRTPVLILGLILKQDIAPLFEYNLTPTVCDLKMARILNQKAHAAAKHINIHIKIDTGMGRIGVLHRDAFTLIQAISRLRNLTIEGVFTHLAFADLNPEFTNHQIDLFNQLVKSLQEKGIHVPLTHTANSMGILGYKDAVFTMVRPGLVLYGLHPKEDVHIQLKPVLSLKTKIIYVKRVPAGYGISYGHDYVTTKDTTIATLPIGYGDGYPRNLSNNGFCLIQGKRFKICGKICMDQIMVDVGDTKVRIGEEVVLIGRQRNAQISAEEIAALAGTIPYEIVCGLGSRIPRVYND